LDKKEKIGVNRSGLLATLVSLSKELRPYTFFQKTFKSYQRPLLCRCALIHSKSKLLALAELPKSVPPCETS
jgi:hypothetical protein